jgi:DNA gyrase subunit A
MAKKTKKRKEESEIGYVKDIDITDEMEESYINYAMSVIVSRALPDVRDGLKPVHRRILYSMYKMGLKHTGGFRKSAAVTGEVLGKYHPHGDTAVYDSSVRMAQNFSLRYPLIIGQGNFGSIDGDPAAAQRYTECKMSAIGETMLDDIERDTVDFVDNYDGTRQEPVVLPSPVPQLLLNGILGIAVGMATSIPPHNLSEVIDASIHLLHNPKADTEDIFEFIKGPDFPTGGQIYNQKGILAAYSQGKGSVVIRGKTDIVKKEGSSDIIITEIPYQVQKSGMIEQIANLIQKKKIDKIRNVRDESDKDGLRVVIELQKGAFPKKVLNQLYKFTDLQRTFYLNMVALVDGIQPRVLSLTDILNYFLEHRKEVITRRTKFDLDKAKKRCHILEGLDKCLADIDKVIKIIKASKDRQVAKRNLMKSFKLTDVQTEAILETKLSTLAKMERDKIAKELAQKRKEIKELTAILKSPKRISEVVEEELKEVKRKYGDERKTEVFAQELGKIPEKDLIPKKPTVVTLTKGGYIKRTSPKSYRVQKRGGKGILGMKTVEEDVIEYFLWCNTHDSLLFFTDSGKVFQAIAYEIPKEGRVAKGRGLANFLDISPDEKVLSLISKSKKEESGVKYLVMVTKNGIIKKTALEDFKNVRRSGLIAINLRKDDLLRKVSEIKEGDQIILVTKKGQSVVFNEKEIRAMGRTASGVKGIKLRKEDEVIGMQIIEPNQKGDLLVVTENGYGKKTSLNNYKAQRRGGVGIKTAKVTSKTGDLVCVQVITNQKNLIAISQKAQIIKVEVSSVSRLSRTTQGVRVMRLRAGDKVASVICV